MFVFIRGRLVVRGFCLLRRIREVYFAIFHGEDSFGAGVALTFCLIKK